MIIANHCKEGTARGAKHKPVCAWPENCYVQWGDSGIVFTGGKGISEDINILSSYVTAFFEAFPRDPDTFIRGEGTTIEEAERKAFAKFTSTALVPVSFP